MNEQNFVPIGMPRGLMDARAFQIMFPAAPPEAFEAMQRANQRRAAEQNQPPLRRHMKAAKPESSKGSTMPAAVATPQAKVTPPATRQPTANEPIITARYSGPPLKTGDRDLCKRVGMALIASAGRATGRPNGDAEVYCRARQIFVPKAIATTVSPATGGYTVADDVAQAIRLRQSKIGALRRLATGYPMKGGKLSVPTEESALTVGYPSEGGSAATATDLGWGSVNFEVQTRTIRGYVSQELWDDAIISMADTFIDRSAHAFSRREDVEMISGDGSASYGRVAGLLTKLQTAKTYAPSNGTGRSIWSGLTLADLVGAMALLPEEYCDGRQSWLMSPAFYYGVALPCVGGAFQGVSPDGRNLLLGHPVDFVAAMPTTTAVSQVSALYGNFAEALAYGDRGIVWKFSDQAAGAFERDLIEVHAASRIDTVVANSDAFTALKTAAS